VTLSQRFYHSDKTYRASLQCDSSHAGWVLTSTKGFSTLITMIGLLPSVSYLMSGKVSFLDKELPMMITLIGFLNSMHPLSLARCVFWHTFNSSGFTTEEPLLFTIKFEMWLELKWKACANITLLSWCVVRSDSSLPQMSVLNFLTGLNYDIQFLDI
jgi:hypothetical protein